MPSGTSVTSVAFLLRFTEPITMSSRRNGCLKHWHRHHHRDSHRFAGQSYIRLVQVPDGTKDPKGFEKLNLSDKFLWHLYFVTPQKSACGHIWICQHSELDLASTHYTPLRPYGVLFVDLSCTCLHIHCTSLNRCETLRVSLNISNSSSVEKCWKYPFASWSPLLKESCCHPRVGSWFSTGAPYYFSCWDLLAPTS